MTDEASNSSDISTAEQEARDWIEAMTKMVKETDWQKAVQEQQDREYEEAENSPPTLIISSD